jgi:RimJ/RimL family protein N-acetyltransferase
MSNKAINAIYLSIKDRLNITPEQFAEAMQDWEFVELKEGDDVIGAVMVKENELHIGYSKKPKFSIRKHLKDTLRKTIDLYGYATTTVMKSNEKGINFCKRLGFEIEKEDQDRLYLKCDRCNYV